MKLHKSLLSLPLSIIVICIAPNNADAAYFSSLTGYSEEQLNQDIANGIFIEDFSAASYIGDNGKATHELEIKDILHPATIESQETAQFKWKNGAEVDFRLSFDGKDLVYEVDDKVVQSINLNLNDVKDSDFNINGMLLSLTSSANSKVEISNLMFEDGSMSMESLLSQGGNIDFIKITGLDNNFTLTGTQTFSWRGQRPSNYDLAYKIKVGSFNDTNSSVLTSRSYEVEVPEPNTVSFLSLGAIALLIKKRRNKVI